MIKLTQTIETCSDLPGCKIAVGKSIVFICTDNEHNGKERMSYTLTIQILNT